MAPRLPTLEAARAQLGSLKVDPGIFYKEVDLLERDPERVANVAGVLLTGTALRREKWAKQVEMSRPLFARYPRDVPAIPERVEENSYKRLVDDGTAREQACTSCRPAADDCAICAGTHRVMRARVEFINDRVVPVSRVLLPELVERLARPLRHAFGKSGVPGADFAVDLKPTRLESAYRGASAVQRPDFHGFDYGSALEAALAARQDLLSVDGLVRDETRMFALPFVHAVWKVPGGTYDVAIVESEDGKVRAIVGDDDELAETSVEGPDSA